MIFVTVTQGLVQSMSQRLEPRLIVPIALIGGGGAAAATNNHVRNESHCQPLHVPNVALVSQSQPPASLIEMVQYFASFYPD